MRKYFMNQVSAYLKNTHFAPWCVGIYGCASGIIGRSRGKRLYHLLETVGDNEEGVVLLVELLLTYTTSKKLHKYLSEDQEKIFAVTDQCARKSQGIDETNLALARRVFGYFLNAKEYPASKYSSDLNCIIKLFKFADLNNSRSPLVMQLNSIDKKMQSNFLELNKEVMNHLRVHR